MKKKCSKRTCDLVSEQIKERKEEISELLEELSEAVKQKKTKLAG